MLLYIHLVSTVFNTDMFLYLGTFLDKNGVTLPVVLGLWDLFGRARGSVKQKQGVVVPLSKEKFRGRCDYLVTQKFIDIIEVLDSNCLCLTGYSYIFE